MEFTLKKVADGTLLTVTESGINEIPAKRRADAFHMNEGGGEEQMKNIEKYVANGS
ncbi:MAG: hypothetical protein K2X29_11735 [Candidatus Obscuribacterales bacterium]|nr:hypothetical protein [Candidatus Obscuribacterales bacterium]